MLYTSYSSQLIKGILMSLSTLYKNEQSPGQVINDQFSKSIFGQFLLIGDHSTGILLQLNKSIFILLIVTPKASLFKVIEELNNEQTTIRKKKFTVMSDQKTQCSCGLENPLIASTPSKLSEEKITNLLAALILACLFSTGSNFIWINL